MRSFLLTAILASLLLLSATQTTAQGNWWLSGGIDAGKVLGAYQAIDASDQASSYVNLANPGTNDLTVGVAPGWTANDGWQFTGSQYLQTSFIPTNTTSMIIRYSDVVSLTENPSLAGVLTGPTGSFYMQGSEVLGGGPVPASPPKIFFNRVQTGYSYTQTITSGVKGIVWLDDNTAYAYAEGNQVASLSNQNFGSSLAIYVGALNGNGSPGSYFRGNIQAIAFYSAALTDAQAQAVSVAMAALATPTPTPTPTIPATATPIPTNTPLPTATPTPTVLPGPDNSIGMRRSANPITMPTGYDFTPWDIPEVQSSQMISFTFGLEQINLVGKVVTTTFKLLDTLEILPTLLVVGLGMFVLRWVYKFVTGIPTTGAVFDATKGIDNYFDSRERSLQQDFAFDEGLDELLEGNRRGRNRARSAVRFLRRRR